MKKLVVLAVFGFVASPLGAQSNTATVAQEGNGHVAEASQSGVDNTADVSQIGSSGKEALITQIGAENLAVVSQGYAGAGAANQLAEQYQEGDRNVAEITSGKESDAYQTQIGSENLATMDQGAYATGEQYQEGKANRAILVQAGSQWQNRSYASQTQVGYRNRIELVQDGAGNSADIRQEGDWNTVAGLYNGWDPAAQRGTGNQLTITSEGNLNRVHMLQDGDLNVADISQRSWQNLVILNQAGDGNQAVVDQQH